MNKIGLRTYKLGLAGNSKKIYTIKLEITINNIGINTSKKPGTIMDRYKRNNIKGGKGSIWNNENVNKTKI